MKDGRSGLLQVVDFFVKRFVGIDASIEQEYVARRKNLDPKDKEHILYDMDIIDSKSAALLTHVSIMLAVVVVLLSSMKIPFWRHLMTAELAAFSMVAMFLLRCVDVMGPPFRMPSDEPSKSLRLFREEVLIRRATYQLMLKTVFLLTGLLIALVLIESLWTTICLEPLSAVPNRG